MNVREKRDRSYPWVGGGEIQARLMLVLLCLVWGITWPMMKIALNEIPPFSMRALTGGLGAMTLLAICLIGRRSLRIAASRTWAHLIVAAFLNIVSFSLFTAFAQVATASSRVSILTYTMPIWSALLGWLILGERPGWIQGLAIALCAVGLAVLVQPLAMTGLPLGVLLAVASGAVWAAGTVYLKWARLEADPMAAASWQLTIAAVVLAACLFTFEGGLHVGDARAAALFCVAFAGVVGNGFAWGLWFAIVRGLPAATASLSVLGSPVIGVVSSVAILGERPTVTDVIGFALIFAASACVLLGPQLFNRKRA